MGYTMRASVPDMPWVARGQRHGFLPILRAAYYHGVSRCLNNHARPATISPPNTTRSGWARVGAGGQVGPQYRPVTRNVNAKRGTVLEKPAPAGVSRVTSRHSWPRLRRDARMLKSERCCGGYTVTEREVQDYFFEHLDEYLPNAKRVIRDDIARDDRRGIPDGWVMLRGCLCPVEVKQRTFGSWAMSQLDSYLKNYHCQHGIAVAERFAYTVPRTHSVTFITVPVDRSSEVTA